MAHLEFCIPATGRDELVQSTKKRGQYTVRRVLNDPSEIQQNIEGRLSYVVSLVSLFSVLICLLSSFLLSYYITLPTSEYSQLVHSNGAAVIHECFDVFYSVCE